MNQSRAMRPQHYRTPTNYLLQCDDGSPVRKEKIEAALKAGSDRLGVPSVNISSHSLRAGGASAKWAMGKSDAEIQFRGRWRSLCWKIYVWGTRERQKDFGSSLWGTTTSLFAAVLASAGAVVG